MSLGFTEEHCAAKLHPIWQLMDVLPRLKLLNSWTVLTCSCCFPHLGHLQPKEFISRKPVQGLNLNRRSISGLEPERPLTQSYLKTVKLRREYLCQTRTKKVGGYRMTQIRTVWCTHVETRMQSHGSEITDRRTPVVSTPALFLEVSGFKS